MRMFLIILAAVIVLLAVAAFVLVRFHADTLASVISDRVRKATGQTLAVSDPGLSVFPRPGVSFGEIRWGDPRYNRISASARDGSLYLALGPLLRGRIEVDAFFLNQPKVLVRSDLPSNFHSEPRPEPQTDSQRRPTPVPPQQTSAAPLEPASSRARASDLSGLVPRRLEIRGGEFEFSSGQDTLGLKTVHLLFEREEPARQSGDLQASASFTLSRGTQSLPFPLTLQGVLSLQETGVVLEKLDAVLAETKVRGSIQLIRWQRLVADLKLDALDLDPWLGWFSRSGNTEPVPAASGALAQSSAQRNGQDPATCAPGSGVDNTPPAKQLETDVRLELGKLTVRDLSLDNLKMQLHGARGLYRVEPCTFDLFGGTVALKVGADITVQPPRYSLDGKADNLSLDAASRSVAGKVYVGGSLSLTTSLTASGSGAEALVRGLSGTGILNGRDIAVETAYLPAEVSRRVGGRHIVFDTLNGAFAANNGLIAVQSLELAGRGIGARAAGEVNVPGDHLQLNGALNVAGLSLPLRVTGSLGHPVFKLDTGRLLLNTLEGLGKFLQKRSAKPSGSSGNP